MTFTSATIHGEDRPIIREARETSGALAWADLT